MFSLFCLKMKAGSILKIVWYKKAVTAESAQNISQAHCSTPSSESFKVK